MPSSFPSAQRRTLDLIGCIARDRRGLPSRGCLAPGAQGFFVSKSTGASQFAVSVIRHPQASPYGQIATASLDVALIRLQGALGTDSRSWSASTTYVGQNLKCFGYGFNSSGGGGLGTLRTAI